MSRTKERMLSSGHALQWRRQYFSGGGGGQICNVISSTSTPQCMGISCVRSPTMVRHWAAEIHFSTIRFGLKCNVTDVTCVIVCSLTLRAYSRHRPYPLHKQQVFLLNKPNVFMKYLKDNTDPTSTNGHKRTFGISRRSFPTLHSTFLVISGQ